MKRLARYLVALIFVVPALGQTLPPLSVWIEQDKNSDSWVVRNNSGASLTAVGFLVDLASTSTRMVYHDAAIHQWHRVEPGGETQFHFQNSGRPAEAQFRCAVFADGSTFGESTCIELALKRRRETLNGLEMVLRQLPQEATTETMAREKLLRQLVTVEFEPPADVDGDLRTAIANINMWVKREIVRRRLAEGKSGQVNIAGIAAMLSEWRDDLARSRPSLTAAVVPAP